MTRTGDGNHVTSDAPDDDDDARDLADRLTDEVLDPLFLDAPRSAQASGWHGHVPFAQWVMEAARPAVLVELGTHNGVSYSAFCDAVLRHRLDTRAYAVDTWQGDEHAGFYSEEVFASLSAFHDARYAGFSRMLRTTFDAACDYFADGSVDLLHIDGLHTFEAVRHDYETWRPKLSRRAVVLFHDINVRENHFGVWRLWATLRDEFPSFEFVHSHGLGVLLVGPDAPPPLRALCAIADPSAVAAIRHRFAQAGLRCRLASDLVLLAGEMAETAEQLGRSEAERSRLEVELRGEIGTAMAALEAAREENARFVDRIRDGERRLERSRLAADVAERRHEEAARRYLAAEEALAQLRAARESEAGLIAAAARRSGVVEIPEGELAALRQAAAVGEAIRQSTVWRATAPVRRAFDVASGRG